MQSMHDVRLIEVSVHPDFCDLARGPLVGKAVVVREPGIEVFNRVLDIDESGRGRGGGFLLGIRSHIRLFRRGLVAGTADRNDPQRQKKHTGQARVENAIHGLGVLLNRIDALRQPQLPRY